MEIKKDLIKKMQDEQKSRAHKWTEEETNILSLLIEQKITDAVVIKKYGFFENRSLNAVRIKIKSMLNGFDNE